MFFCCQCGFNHSLSVLVDFFNFTSPGALHVVGFCGVLWQPVAREACASRKRLHPAVLEPWEPGTGRQGWRGWGLGCWWMVKQITWGVPSCQGDRVLPGPPCMSPLLDPPSWRSCGASPPKFPTNAENVHYLCLDCSLMSFNYYLSFICLVIIPNVRYLNPDCLLMSPKSFDVFWSFLNSPLLDHSLTPCFAA